MGLEKGVGVCYSIYRRFGALSGFPWREADVYISLPTLENVPLPELR